MKPSRSSTRRSPAPPTPPESMPASHRSKRIKVFLFLFFKKESAFFFEKKRIASGDRANQKTFIR
jgi:hypothetical protein